MLPFYEILNFKHHEYLLLIKTLRIKKGLKAMSATAYIDRLREFTTKRVQNMIVKKLPDANNKRKNNTFISQLVYSLQVLRIFESFVVLTTLSFFLGIFWVILCELQNEYMTDFNGDSKNFLTDYGFDIDRDNLAVSVTYFCTTTLTTVGFGDFHPKSNFECIMCTILMIIGVRMFSSVYSKVDSAITKIRQIRSPLMDAHNQLEQFFNVLQRFNGNQPLQKEIRSDIETYFEFRWQNDKTQALQTRADQELFEQLPHSVRYRIYSEFLFDEFLLIFAKNFKIRHKIGELKKGRRTLGSSRTNLLSGMAKRSETNQFYGWNNPAYADFVIGVLNNLEPRILEPNSVIFHEKQMVFENYYLTKSQILVGIGLKKGLSKIQSVKYVTQLKAGDLVGVEMLFDICSKFYYRTQASRIECLGMRKTNWLKLQNGISGDGEYE